MQIYIVRTEVDYEVPSLLGYYTTRQAAEERIEDLQVEANDEGDSYPLNLDDVIIEEVTLDEAITPPWM